MKHKKRALALTMALVLLAAVIPPVYAQEPNTPSPPPWIAPDEYVIFPGDEVYLPENWAIIEKYRDEVLANRPLPNLYRLFGFYLYDNPESNKGLRYEIALIELKNAANTKNRTSFYDVFHHLYIGTEFPKTPQIRLWYLRAKALYSTVNRELYKELSRFMKEYPLTWEQFFDASFMEIIPEEERVALKEAVAQYENRVEVLLDGDNIELKDAKPEMRNGRIMAPVRLIADPLGIDVTWDGDAKKVKLRHAGDIVEMRIGDQTAYLNGRPVPMDAAPYLANGRTYFPLRYVAELFGQKVEWDEEKRQARITEDFTVAGDSNILAWAFPMGAIHQSLADFGRDRTMRTRDESVTEPDGTHPFVYINVLMRKSLAETWGISSREDLIETISDMTFHGHNDMFLEAVALGASLSEDEMEELLRLSGETDRYMWPYTMEIYKEWGDRGIMCWDLFRMCNVARWGYEAGYVTYAEALALIEPAARRLQENFSSWDEAYENYLHGYNWWARNNVLGQNIWETERGVKYTQLKTRKDADLIFDDALFQQKIIPVPGVTMDELAAGLQ